MQSIFWTLFLSSRPYKNIKHHGILSSYLLTFGSANILGVLMCLYIIRLYVYCTYCVYRIPLTLTYINYYWLFSLGKLVAINPFKTICFSLSLTALCGLGLFSFYEEKDLVKLWIPENNDFATNHQWLIHNFPPKIRHVNFSQYALVFYSQRFWVFCNSMGKKWCTTSNQIQVIHFRAVGRSENPGS